MPDPVSPGGIVTVRPNGAWPGGYAVVVACPQESFGQDANDRLVYVLPPNGTMMRISRRPAGALAARRIGSVGTKGGAC